MTKIKVSTKDLKKATSTAEKFVNPKSYRFVYTQIKLSVEDNSLKVRSYSERFGCELTVPITETKSTDEHTIGLIDPELVKAILTISADQVWIEFTEKNIVVESLSKFELPSKKDIDEFHDLQPLQSPAIQVTREHVKALGDCEPFLSQDFSTQIQMSGARLMTRSGLLQLTGTDSCALIDYKFPDVEAEDSLIIISKDGLKIVSELDSISALRISDSRLQLEGQNTIVQILLLDGHYPNVEVLFDSLVEASHFLVSKSSLELALKAAIMVSEGTSIASLELKDAELTVATKKSGKGKNKTKLEIKEFTGKLKINLDATRLLAYLKIVKEDELYMSICKETNNGATPIVVKDNNKNRRFVIVPTEMSFDDEIL